MPENPVELRFDDTSVAFSSRTDSELRKMYWLFAAINQSWLIKPGTMLLNLTFKLRLPIKGIVRKTVFSHFCGGESISDCENTIRALSDFGIGTILDYSVEGEKTDRGFEKTTKETILTIEKAAGSTNIPFSVFKITGIARMGLLAKIQSGEQLSNKERAEYERVKERVNRICSTAHSLDIRVFIDGEDSWIQDVIDGLAYEMMALYNKEKPLIYNTFQMYRADMLNNLRDAFHKAAMGQYWLGAKLVRGAYMEKERDRARKMGYNSPIQPDKASTDRDFDKALQYCIDNKQRIALCAGTHNEHSTLLLTVLMDKYNISPKDPNVYFAQLYGMSDNISYSLAKAGYNVAKYVPYGPVKAVLPYLFRRAEENTSVAGQSSREFMLIKKEIQRRKRDMN